MRFLVTGGAGFLGSELIIELAKIKGNEIYVFDSYVHGYPEKLTKRQGIKDLIVGNIKDYSSISRAVEKTVPDVIVHLAAHITRPESVGEFRTCATTNYVGIANLLDCCLHDKYRPKKIVFASSEAIRNPFSHYGISKYAAEQLLEALCPMAGVKLAILRFSEIYGLSRSQTSKSLVNFLVDQMVVDQSVALYDVNRKKDYVHISDAVKACKLAIRSKEPLLKVDIGPGDAITTKKLVEKLRGFMDFKGQFKYLDFPGVRSVDSIADPLPAKALLGFECQANFDKELRKLIAKRKKDLSE